MKHFNLPKTCLQASFIAVLAGPLSAADSWIHRLTRIENSSTSTEPSLKLVRQDYELLEFNRSILKTPLVIGGRHFDHGIGTHSISHIQIESPEPIVRFDAFVGVDDNDRTHAGAGSVVFRAVCGEKEVKSRLLRGGQAGQSLSLDSTGCRTLHLYVDDGGDGPGFDHADWAGAQITIQGGKIYRLDELAAGNESHIRRKYPFTFTYDGKSSETILDDWRHEQKSTPADKGLNVKLDEWSDPATGLTVILQSSDFPDYPARDWMLSFENQAHADTATLENVQAANITFRSPLSRESPYVLHRTHGGPAGPTDFEPSQVALNHQHPLSLNPGQGRGSHDVFPFFKIDTAQGAAILAVGWSGMWKADFICPDDRQLQVTAGLEKTHFRLHPGERVRGPRILLLAWEGGSAEANAQFRQLIFKHYAAKRSGKTPLPTLFCNTCFTRGGGWLNECNAQNQISLINAYAPLGLEVLLTDAGWFEGGWPAGAGNWNPRKDAYPEGMGPVAAAAKDKGMIYGLWFEPERVVAGTDLHKSHRDWLLASQDSPQDTYLLDFGRPKVRDYFFEIVKGYMQLPGFRVYRQDFNMDPLPYWRHTDAPDRQGISEMKYIEGLYAYWDRIADAWPDSWREECASGGNRIDLETVHRMHCHQKSDYWFHDETDQGALWGLSQYLPNNVVVAHLNRMDDYSFHSTLASSLCMGWIADAPDFDFQRGKKLLDRYLQIRHLLIGAWYPLLPYSRDDQEWIGSQYHRPDLDEGMLLIFRHGRSPYRGVDVSLRGLKPDAVYELTFDSTGENKTVRGSELARQLTLTLPEKHRSDLIVYHAVKP